MDAQTSISDYLYGLEQGFSISYLPEPTFVSLSPDNRKGTVPSWIGIINIGNQDLTVLIQIKDWDFISLPKIYIKKPIPLSWNKILPIPHLGPLDQYLKGDKYLQLCYSLPDAHDLNKRNPKGIVEWILFDKAKSVLEANISNKEFRDQEFLRELKPFWESLADIQSCKKFLHTKKTQLSCELFFDFDLDSLNSSDRAFEINMKWVQSFIKKDPENFTTNTLVMLSNKKNIPTFAPLINDLNRYDSIEIRFGIFCRWLERLDGILYKKFVEAFIRFLNSRKKILPVCLVFQKQPLSFFIKNNDLVGKLDLKKIQKELLGASPISILNLFSVRLQKVINISSDFIYNRNLKNMNQRNLEGMRVAIIGCGAIGGYLGLSLARLGAGASGGKLYLIDFDELTESNLGRHALGMKYIGHNKAAALRKEIEEQLPGLNIGFFKENAIEKKYWMK